MLAPASESVGRAGAGAVTLQTMPATTDEPATSAPAAEAASVAGASDQPEQTSATSIERGRPSYSWRYGQDRRLEMVRGFVDLEDARVLDVGCGIGTYVRRFRQYSDDVHGIEVEEERVAEASEELSNIVLAVGEALPYPDDHFDLVFSNEVIEHVKDDRATAAEMVRVTKPGGYIVAFAPNRLYPFETHGAYFGKRYVFGNIPLVNWLPDPLRDRFAPHVRAYTMRGIERLFDSGKRLGKAIGVVEHDEPGEYFVSLLLLAWGKFINHLLHSSQCIKLMITKHIYNPARDQMKVFSRIRNFKVAI